MQNRIFFIFTKSVEALAATDFGVVEDATRPRQSPRMTIRGLLGAPRLTTSECSRQRVQASELAHPLAADPQRVKYQDIMEPSELAINDLTAAEQSLFDSLPGPPVSAVIRSTNIWIIEWLPSDEQRTGRLLHEWMQEH